MSTKFWGEFILGSFMYIFLVICIVVCIAVGLSLFFRSRFYKKVDQIELWKNELENRNIQNEISKVKSLNMNGETEVLFEEWRNSWEKITTEEVEKILHLSFDAEEFASTFRFLKARKLMATIEERRQVVEDEIARIVSEVNELIGSEEKNQAEIQKLEEKHQDLYRQIISNSFTYGEAEAVLQKKLKEGKKIIAQFYDVTAQGNYLTARELVLKVEAIFKDVELAIQILPVQMTEAYTNLPTLMQDLHRTYHHLLTEEYSIEHIEFEKEYTEIGKQIEALSKCLDQAEHEKAEEMIQGIRKKIEKIFSDFEKEKDARIYLRKESAEFFTQIQQFVTETTKSNEEITIALQSYHIQANDIDMLKQIEKQARLFEKRLDVLINRFGEKNVAYTVLQADLDLLKKQYEETKEQYELYLKNIQDIRKEELYARNEIQKIEKVMFETKRIVECSNLPGFPEEFAQLLRHTKTQIQAMHESLGRNPLNVTEVTGCLYNAKLAVLNLNSYSIDLIHEGIFAEKLMQHCNRFRSSYPEINEILLQAEIAFRSYNYAKARELGQNLLLEIEPESIGKIERTIVIEDVLNGLSLENEIEKESQESEEDEINLKTLI